MNDIIKCSECETTTCFVKENCSPECIGKISDSKNQTVFKKGQYIFKEGDRVFGLYFIQEGKVKVISTGLNDKEQIVRLATDGHLIGHRGYGSETYPIGAVALEDTRACFVDNDMLYETFMKNPKFTYALMMFYAFELRKTEIRQRHLAQMSTREKLVDTLIYLKEIFGMNAKEKSLNVILSRQELADIAGTTAEQITRELSELEKEKLIKKQGKKILLLNELALNKIISLHDTSEKYASWKNYDAEVLHRSENE